MPSDPLVLGFDTSAAHCAAALLSGDRLLGAISEPMARGQAERLFPLLDALLKAHGAGWGDLDAIGVGIGPGNFTGIRLSVAAARGLALARGIPAVGVSGFDARAFGLTGAVTALIAAPRDRVHLHQRPATGAAHAPLLCHRDAIADLGLRTDLWVGDHAQDCADALGGAARAPLHPPAEAIARIAAQRRHDAPARPAPLYLRPADAAPARDAPPVILDDA